MKVKELKKRLDTCNDDLEVRVIRDGDIPGSEEHIANGAYVICEATENLEYLNAFYLVWDEA